MKNSTQNYMALAISISLSSSVALAAPFNPVTAGNSNTTMSNHEVYKVGTPYEINGIKYIPEKVNSYDVIGIASWYGEKFDGKTTSNGEIYNMNKLTAAHATLPMPSFVEITNLENGKKAIVRINDRGPFTGGRDIDLSKRAAELLGFVEKGTAKVRITLLSDISEQAINNTNVVSSKVVNNSHTTNLVDNSLAQVKTVASQLNSSPTKAEIVSDTEEGLKNVNLVEPSNIRAYVPRGVFIQLGAFSDDNKNVIKEANSLSNIGVVSLQKVDINGKNILRLRVGPYGSIDDAIKIKNRLVKLGYSNSRVVVEE